MTSKLSAATMLRTLLERPGITIAPGAPDPLTALIAQQTGFEALHCTGGGIARSFGFPDLGYLTLSELVGRVASMTEVCSLPMIVDVDSGHGTALNAQRAVRLLERAGAAGMHIEDEEVPRRVADPKSNILAAKAMAAKLQAAAQARSDAAFVIIGRTNALPYLGIDEAIARADCYADAGADLVYVEFMRTRKDIEAVAARVNAPKMLTQNKGETELLPASELAEMGYKLVVYPSDAQLAALFATKAVLGELKDQGTLARFSDMLSFVERDQIVNATKHKSLRERFLRDT
jgi:2-methylisocitrate lyase-like PEP mutase family enzyme